MSMIEMMLASLALTCFIMAFHAFVTAGQRGGKPKRRRRKAGADVPKTHTRLGRQDEEGDGDSGE